MTSAHSEWAWKKLSKARIDLAREVGEPCSVCHLPIDYTLHGNHRDGATADHPDMLQLGGELLPPIGSIGVAHRHCNSRQGAKVSNAIRRRRAPRRLSSAQAPTPPPIAATTPETPRGIPRIGLGAHPKWWPDHLRTPPDNATFPRLETPHHSEAVGTLGPLVVAHAATYGLQLRWWQEYAIHRLLEHDKDGTLLWAEAGVSVARQVGKGHGLIRPLCEWRMAAAEHFGEVQTVLHLAHQVNAVLEIATPAIARHRDLGHRVRLTNGEQSIQLPDGSRWLMRSTTGAYGFSVSLAVVDEVWFVSPRTIDSMVMPTMVERVQPQLLITSTANALPTPLYPSFVASAGEEESRLLLEWSPPPEAADHPGDRRYWRMGSPHWSAQRERMMARQLGKALRADFVANWLNCWPEARSSKYDKALPRFGDLGKAPPEPPRGGIVAMDESRDGSKVGVVRLMRDWVWYSEHTTLADAVKVANTADQVVVGLSLADASVRAGLRHRPVKYGLGELRIYTPLLVATVASGRLAHNHHPRLLEAAAGAVTTETETGKTISAKRSEHEVLGVKLIAWALGFRRASDGAPRARIL